MLGRHKQWVHIGALACVVLAIFSLLYSPINTIGQHHHFSISMFQKTLLVYVFPWLFALIFQGVLSTDFKQRFQHIMSFALWVSLGFSILFSVGFIPLIYEFTVQYDWLYQMHHLALIGLGLGMWWPFFFAARQRFGEQMFYIVTLIAGQIPLFGLLALTREPIYSWYVQAPYVWNMSTLQDQQVAGWLFKLLSIQVFGVMFIILAIRWHQEQNRIDKAENKLSYENFNLVQKAPRIEG